MKRSMIVWLRIATVLIGVMGAAVLAFSLLGRLDYDVSSAFRCAIPFLSIPCFAALVIFWAAQVLFVLLLCRVYLAKADPACVNAQTVFLAFYRQKFLHSLLPLAETSRWVRVV